MDFLSRYKLVSPVMPVDVWEVPDLAALTLSRTSLSASSAARPRSRSSRLDCRRARSSLIEALREDVRLWNWATCSSAGVGGRLLMTPVACQFAVFQYVLTALASSAAEPVRGFWDGGECCSSCGVSCTLGGVDLSLFVEDRGWRLVMLPLILRISSTSWTSSGGFAFLSRM